MAIRRRDVFKTLAAVPLAGLSAIAKDSSPNILFVLADDHSYPYLGIYGATWMSTPTLD
jgi:N-sulfoglucosamine sulfohydrolase